MFHNALRRATTQCQRDFKRASSLLQAQPWVPPLQLRRRIHAGSDWRPKIRDAFSIDVGNDTIYALSSGSGRAGIAVVRISGPSCLDVRRALLS